MLIDDDVLLDAGTGVGDLTMPELLRIRHVFLTHSHLDHVAGLALFLDTVFGAEPGTPVNVYARAETLAALREHLFNWVIWPDFSQLPDAENPMLNFVVCDPGSVVPVGDRRVRAVSVKHSVPALGFCFTQGERVLAVSGDTATNESLWPVLNELPGLDVLIIEVSFPNAAAELARDSGHYCPASLAEDLAKLRHQPNIWLTAMKPGEEQIILDEVRRALPQRHVNMLNRGTVIDL